MTKEGGQEEGAGSAIAAGEVGVATATGAGTVRSLRTDHTCCCLGVLVGISLIAALVAVILMKDSKVEVTILRQVHVLMSHGERTPSERELAMLGAPPPDHVFEPYGAGAMTNEGKTLTFEMGVLLRKRYNDFLGPFYIAEDHVVIASDNDLSKTTALLLSAGLWPPGERLWPELDWQPVPYTYVRKDKDFLLYEENCPRYMQEKQRILNAFIEEGLLTSYKDLFVRITQLTNTNFSTPEDAFLLNNLFVIQDDIKVANPKWAKHVRRKLSEIARLEYMMMFYNNLLRKLSGGALLQQILQEALLRSSGQGPKLLVRTGTALSVAALLSACGSPAPRPPDPGVALLIEMHERVEAVDKRFGFKIFYWDDDSAEPRLMEVPGCSDLCPLETFIELTKYIVCLDYRRDCAPVAAL